MFVLINISFVHLDKFLQNSGIVSYCVVLIPSVEFGEMEHALLPPGSHNLGEVRKVSLLY